MIRRLARFLEGIWSAAGEAADPGPDLVYAANARCSCGAGMAYDRRGESGRPISGYWDCSAILLGEAIESGQPGAVKHEARLPFAFWKVLGENSPRADGSTTRPPR